MSNSNILVIIVSYNGSNWIVNCIESLFNSDIVVDVICVDNNSSDNTVSLIESNFPSVIIKRNKINLGFGQANNVGLDFALSNNFDFVFLLNQDTIVKQDAIRKLYDNYLTSVKCGLLSPLHLDESENYLDINFEYFLTRQKKNRFLSNYFLNKVNTSSTFQVGFVNAAAWFMSVETLKKVGYFNPLFFHYGEDLDWYNRLIYHGLNCFIQIDSIIIHYYPQKKGRDFSSIYKRAKREYAERVADFANINRSFLNGFKMVFSLTIRNLLSSLFFLRFKNIHFEGLILIWLIGNMFSIYNCRLIAKKTGAFN